ncbi:T9SS type A sorting domain-containing protein [Cryomorpha ignava]|uniref:T9SS type A sorting domain-containing protein n=1 Tax=Cryomorpha ignava TaxID=101383 RepID=A0A7K3WNF1_9FLAO|nr:T9SS type A sorting domain-containing protein [Cryomorpha ignava]NEN23183.1 T9SS type A sorting domain-containing protein [Cryomorpha ignava]
MKRLINFICLVIVAQAAYGQAVFQRSYGGPGNEYGRAVIECSGGGYLIVGSTNSYYNPSTDVYLLRVDENGDYLWGRNIGESSKIDWGIDLAEDADGNFIIAGYTDDSPSGSYDGLLIKTDPDGQVIWKKTFGGDDWDFIEGMALNNADEIVLAGSKTVNGIQKGWVFKTDSDGELIWETLIESSSQLKITGVDICDDQNIVFTGFSSNNLLETKTFVVGRISQECEIVWVTNYPEFGQYEASGCVCWENFIISIGTKYESNDYSRINLSSIDLSSGLLQWMRSLNNPEPNVGLGINVNLLGNILVAGGIKDIISPDYSAISFEFNSQGQDIAAEYAVLQGSIGEDLFYDVVPVSDGGYVCVGHSNSFGNNYQVLLSKIGANGERDLTNTDFLDLATTSNPQILENEIKIFPNPAQDFIQVDSEESLNYTFNILGIDGKQFLDGNIKDQPDGIAIRSLPSGLFILKLYESGELKSISRFVKLP